MTNPPGTFFAPQVVVSFEKTATAAYAQAMALAERCHLPFHDPVDIPATSLCLLVTNRRVELRPSAGTRDGPVFVDFLDLSPRVRGGKPSSKKELIARAVGLKGQPLFVLDATAGFARDAFVLAMLGGYVRAVERSPVVVALVEDGLARARASNRPRIIEALDRLTIETGDARDLLRRKTPAFSKPPSSFEPRVSAHATSPPATVPTATATAIGSDQPVGSAEASITLPRETGNIDPENMPGCATQPDVIYLDPMYPDLGRSARNRKELRLLRTLVGDDPDAVELFDLARRVARRRVVVKRPRHAPPLAPHPDIQYQGASVRFDTYLIAGHICGSGNAVGSHRHR